MTLLRVADVTVRMDSTTVLRGVSFAVPENGVVALVGRNGAGKTTTLRAVMGLVPAQSGEIRFDDVDLRRTPSHRRAGLGIGYAPEDRRLIPSLTVEQNLLLPAIATGLAAPQARLAETYELIPIVRDFAARRSSQLSGGQQKLVAVARAAMIGSRLLILDEPFEGLAPALAQRIGEAISAARGRGVATLIAESDPRHVERIADTIYVIERGETLDPKSAGAPAAQEA